LFDIVEVEPKALLIHAESFYGGYMSFHRKLKEIGQLWLHMVAYRFGSWINNEFVTFTVSAIQAQSSGLRSRRAKAENSSDPDPRRQCADAASEPAASQLAPLDRRNAVEINPIIDTRRLIIAVEKTPIELKVVETLHISRPIAYPKDTHRL
jgi:hypothetical protein